MKVSFSRSGWSDSSTLPSCMALPSPLAHHSLLWKPLPEKRTARRTGASLAERSAPARGSSPQTRTDSIHGRAMVTPMPRRKARRSNWCDLPSLLLMSVRPGFKRSFVEGHVAPADLAELSAAHDQVDGDADMIIAGGEFGLHFFQQRFVR